MSVEVRAHSFLRFTVISLLSSASKAWLTLQGLLEGLEEMGRSHPFFRKRSRATTQALAQLLASEAVLGTRPHQEKPHGLPHRTGDTVWHLPFAVHRSALNSERELRTESGESSRELHEETGSCLSSNLEHGNAGIQWERLIFHVSDVDRFWAYLMEKGFYPDSPHSLDETRKRGIGLGC